MDSTRLAFLLETAPYEESTILELEAVVTHFARTNTYDFNVIRALFKSYQVNVNSAKVETVCHGLMIALMRLPSSDFLSLSYLIPHKFGSHSDVVLLLKCADLLERGKFGEFWELYVSVPDSFFGAAVGFVDVVRIFILANMRDTFRTVPCIYFQNSLGLDGPSVITYCKNNEFIEKVREIGSL